MAPLKRPNLSWSAPFQSLDGDLSSLVAEFERTMSAHAPDSPSEAWSADSSAALWNALADGTWLDLGIHDAAAGVSFTVVELAEFARVWGRYLAPLPFLETMLWNRWTTGEAAPGGRAVTFALEAGESCLAPHGATADILIDPGSPAAPPDTVDDFAPSLPLAELTKSSSLADDGVVESLTLLAAEAIGAAEMAMSQGLKYTHQREAYGRTINQFQALRHWAADMQRDLELAKSCVFYMSRLTDPLEAGVAARSAVNRAQSVASRSIQLFGGIGFTWDLGLHFYVRHTMAAQRLLCS
jgi:alkylation response protein AidB-like acyl-CoA dehydrogenase